MKNLFISLLLASLLAACATQKTNEESAAGSQAAPAGAATGAQTGSMQSSETAMDPLNDPNSILAKRSVYYPFDISAVQDADKPIVEAHAKYLSQHPDRKVRLEGNCDERGSDEYNLALGQRRADGVKKMLMVGGVNGGQIDTVSYGEERPRKTCHAEECWKENRRTDLNYNPK